VLYECWCIIHRLMSIYTELPNFQCKITFNRCGIKYKKLGLKILINVMRRQRQKAVLFILAFPTITGERKKRRRRNERLNSQKDIIV